MGFSIAHSRGMQARRPHIRTIESAITASISGGAPEIVIRLFHDGLTLQHVIWGRTATFWHEAVTTDIGRTVTSVTPCLIW